MTVTKTRTVVWGGLAVTLAVAVLGMHRHMAKAQDDAGGGGKGREKAEAEKIQGSWTAESMRRFGKGHTGDAVKGMRFSFAGDRLTFTTLDGEQAGTFRLDPTTSPKAIDMTLDGKAVTGIYEFSGDSLKLCYFRPEDPRPTDFDGGGVHLAFVLKKAPAKAAPASREAPAGPPAPAKPAVDPNGGPSPEDGASGPAFASDPGCQWLVTPAPARDGMWGQDGVNAVLDKDKDGALLVTMAHLVARESDIDFRPVVFDAGRKRHLPAKLFWKTTGDGLHGVNLTRYRLDPKQIPGGKAAYFGIEVVTPKSRRLLGDQAAGRARTQGVDVLPFPEVGRAYDFTLTTLDGKKLSSRDLRGKVVLVDCWATWCRPCMAKMPKLKELYEKWHGDGFEIVGMSFDEDADQVRKACTSRGLAWPQAMVPADEKARALWEEASGIQSIPRLLLVDRDGVLRADNPEDLGEAVGKLMTAKR